MLVLKRRQPGTDGQIRSSQEYAEFQLQQRSGSGVREDIRPDEVQEEVETETPEVDDGETTGGLQAEPGGAPVPTAAFSKLEGDSSMWSEVDMRRTETLQGELSARSWARRGPARTRCSDAAAGSWSWAIRWPTGAPCGDATAVFACGRRERRKAVPRRHLGPGQSGGQWGRRVAMPQRGLGLGPSGGRQERCEAVPRRGLGLGQSGDR